MPTPILEWDFSTANYSYGTSVSDISGNGNNGTFNAAPLSYNPTIGWIELSSAQEVRVPNVSYPNNLPVGTAAKSMVYWGTISDYDHTAMSFGGNTVAGSRIDFGYSFTNGTFGIEFSGTGLYSAGYNPGLNTFFQVVITSATSGTISSSLVYIDGVLRTMTATNGLVSNTINLPGGPGDPLNTFALNWQVVPGNPKILNARVYDVVLSPAEVATDYTDFLNRLNPIPPLPTPIGEYDFSDVASYPGTGNTMYDLSGTGNTLTNPTLSGTFGGTGQSKYYSFAGGADQFYKDAVAGFAGTQLFTGSTFIWVKSSDWNNPPQSGAYNYMTGWGIDVAPGGGHLGFAKKLSSSFWPDGTFGQMGSAWGAVKFPTLTNNTWYHFGYVADGTTCHLYLDGVEVGSLPQQNQGANPPYNAPTGVTGFIGRDPLYAYTPWITLGGLYSNYAPGSNFDIAIAEFYNVGFASTQVLQLYNSQSARFPAGPPPPYVGSVGGRQFGGRFAG